MVSGLAGIVALAGGMAGNSVPGLAVDPGRRRHGLSGLAALRGARRRNMCVAPRRRSSPASAIFARSTRVSEFNLPDFAAAFCASRPPSAAAARDGVSLVLAGTTTRLTHSAGAASSCAAEKCPSPSSRHARRRALLSAPRPSGCAIPAAHGSRRSISARGRRSWSRLYRDDVSGGFKRRRKRTLADCNGLRGNVAEQSRAESTWLRSRLVGANGAALSRGLARWRRLVLSWRRRSLLMLAVGLTLPGAAGRGILIG